jgi:uncharacterized protein
MKPEKQANRLAHESSPYLLQHAYNPVDWYPWGDEALEKARNEQKPILLSIGYSSCHWCHVMERESFENEAIAELMNEHFVCIKVDREERPDVDHVYMDAIQAMGLPGGWPLNVFLTPDQKPFYGGTYFPPKGWGQLLHSVAQAFEENLPKLQESAEKFVQVLKLSESEKYGLDRKVSDFGVERLKQSFVKISAKVDNIKGGISKAPKFPMPCLWQFFLRYLHVTDDQTARQQLKVTLDHMNRGGIYDQIGGGFSRYSVDGEWLVPHFEKMLYDNGQLVSLYSEAYSIMPEHEYKQTVYQTIDFIQRELSSEEGGFYSALDADSEGVEGKFYVWEREEFDAVLGEQAEMLAEYFDVTPQGNWEHHNILHREMSDENFAGKYDLNLDDLRETIREAKEVLLEKRSHRIRPGLDDKILTGWNGIMLKGLTDAYAVFGEAKFLKMALDNAEFIESKLRKGKGLYRTYKEGKASLPGYLEDYAFVIQAYIKLYEVTFHEKWLHEADQLAQYAIENFFDPQEELFYFTDSTTGQLVARKKELFDNVIPSSNSVMATNLHLLGLLLDKEEYKTMAQNMLAKVNDLFNAEAQYLSNWGSLYTYMSKPTAEVVISGPKAEEYAQQLHQSFYPNKVVAGCRKQSDLPLLQGREAKGDETKLYLCYNKACQRPVDTVEELLEQLKQV